MRLRFPPSIRLAARGLLVACMSLSALTGEARASAPDGAWRLSEADGQCDATTPLVPSQPSQFAVGLSRRGTHLTLQNLRWRLTDSPTHTMTVRFAFDHAPPIETDALVIVVAGAFQIFIPSPTLTEAQFWHGFLTAERVHVSGPFGPGSVDFKLKDAKQAAALLGDCARRQLPGQPPPFDLAP